MKKMSSKVANGGAGLHGLEMRHLWRTQSVRLSSSWGVDWHAAKLPNLAP